MVSYCSISNDRSLTRILIENSNKSSSKCFHNFVNTPEWVDGLDSWSSTQIIKRTDISRRYLDFDEDLGLYLPRYEKINSTPIPTKNNFIYSKGTNKNFYPERVKQFFKKEENHLNNSSTDEQLSLSEDTNQTININQKPSSTSTPSTKRRFPLRQVESNHSYRENKSESTNRERIHYLFKEQLSNFFTRETTNINSKRTVIRIPSVEIKHQNLPPRTIPLTDPVLIMERYTKLQQLLISPLPSQPTISNKLSDNRQSPYIFQGISTLGLTVTPMDFSSSKNLHNSSEDKTSQQENSSSTNRPITQPVLPSSIQQNEEQQTISLKRNIETGFGSSSGDFILSNKNSIDEQTQTIKKFHRYHRSLSKHSIQRGTTLQLLPHISGKRIHAIISNQRNS